MVNLESTFEGDLFKEYFKKVFARVDNGGQTKWFAKSIKDKYIQWIMLPTSPFFDSSSKFFYKDLLITAKGEMLKRKSISCFIDTIEDINIYKEVDFIPFLYKEDIADLEKNVLNLFSGYKYEPLDKVIDLEEDYYDDIKLVLNHLYEVLCNSDDIIYSYMIKWLAHLVKKPWDKSGVPTIRFCMAPANENLCWLQVCKLLA